MSFTIVIPDSIFENQYKDGKNIDYKKVNALSVFSFCYFWKAINSKKKLKPLIVNSLKALIACNKVSDKEYYKTIELISV